MNEDDRPTTVIINNSGNISNLQTGSHATIETVATVAGAKALEYRDGSYWRPCVDGNSTGPFCSRCFEVEGLEVHMDVTEPFCKFHCPHCRRSRPGPDTARLMAEYSDRGIGAALSRHWMA